MRSPLLALAVHHVMHRPVRTGMTIMGVAIGMSAAMAIHLANQAVYEAFEHTVTHVVGETTLVVTGKEGDLDETILANLQQHPAIYSANPILSISARVASGPLQGQALVVWGMDLVELVQQGKPGTSLRALFDIRTGSPLFAVDSLLVSEELAENWGLRIGDPLTLRVGSMQRRVTIQGRFPLSSFPLLGKHVVIMDIAAAQVLFNRLGRLDRIDLVTQPNWDVEAVRKELSRVLNSAPIVIRRPAHRSRQVERMLQTFQMNLTTLGGVGLFVGTFLVYNTIAFSVVQYRREIGVLRAIGMPRHEIGLLFLGEAAAMGFVGGLLGTGLGSVLAHSFVVWEGQSVSELYARVTVETIPHSVWLYGVGSSMGMIVGLLGAIGPCREASHTSAARALAPGDYEQTQTVNRYRYLWLSGMFLALAGLLALPGPLRGIPVFGYLAACCVLLACSFLGPWCIWQVSCLLWRAGRGLPLLSLAANQLARAPGRNSVTLSALMVGIAIMLGIGLMIHSFRQSVEMWIDQTLVADLIVAPRSGLYETESSPSGEVLSPQMIGIAGRVVGVEAVDPYRQRRIAVGDSEVILVARDFRVHAARSRYLFRDGKSSEILRQATFQPGVIVSEVFSHMWGVQRGDHITLPTAQGEQVFPILGVFYDYATDGGKIVMDRSWYRRWWQDSSATVLAIYVEKEANISTVKANIEHALGSLQNVSIIEHGELRREILDIFDRTFRVTYGLELIALVVGMLGIVNTLLTSLWDRQREFATLRAIGASAAQIRRLVFAESLLLALLGCLLGLLGGTLLAGLLLGVINKQSFGWTVPFHWSNFLVGQALAVGLVAALGAGLFPAWWITQRPISEGLRHE
ncbi:MAG: ABC transporter permease [Nitrospirae bacterium]|nr:MAG: ABC transporter permease [Nitrospirota bacterium]